MAGVSFNLDGARRIVNAVRKVEQQRQEPLRFSRVIEQRDPNSFRIATFTGAWSIGSAKVVTFKYQTTTPNTASVTNLFWPIPSMGTRDCSIAKDGTAWFLIVPQLDSGAALSSATLGSNLEFGRINVPSFGTAATVSISVTTCVSS